MAEDTLNIVQKKVAVELEIDPTLKAPKVNKYQWLIDLSEACLLYTSDAADD